MSSIRIEMENKPSHNEDDLFTILTAGKNNDKYVADWSKSILQQSYRPLEVIYFDDASKDKTTEELKNLGKRFEKEDIYFRFLKSKQNQKCASAYLRALEHAHGDFFGILDSDDMLMPDAVDFIIDRYNQNPEIGWIYTQFERCDLSMKTIKKGISGPPDLGCSLLDMAKKNKHCFSHWRTFSRRVPDLHCILKEGLKNAVDKYMGYRLEEISPGAFVDVKCYKYRLGVSNTLSQSSSDAKHTWSQISKEAKIRRKKNNLKPHPVYQLEKNND